MNAGIDSNKTVIIKVATTQDAVVLMTIARQSFWESHGQSASANDIETYIADKYSLEAITNDLIDPGNIIHLIYYEGQPAGFSKIVFNSPVHNISALNICKLERLYLLKAYYGQKLGRKLLQFNIDLCKENRQLGMWLYTWIENERAIKFYQKAGFKIIGKADFRISDTHSNPNHQMFLKF